MVLTPLIAGITTAVGAWALDVRQGIGSFALTAGILGSIGTFVTKAALGGPALRCAVTEEMELAERRRRESTLDQLDRRLTEMDRDSRPEVALRDLRALGAAFDDRATQHAPVSSVTAVEIMAQVRHLCERSIHSLHQTAELQSIAGRLNSASAAAPILAERERLIAEVQATVRQLGQVLATWPTPGTEVTATELSQLRHELDTSLASARHAEARLEQILSAMPDDARPARPEFSRRSVNTSENS